VGGSQNIAVKTANASGGSRRYVDVNVWHAQSQAAGSAMVGFLQFCTIDMALLVAGTSLVINSIKGFLLTPWLTSRASKMNPVAVFIGVLAWGWLWGAWGLLLVVPILMVIKAICDRIDDLNTVGELLDD
jgi:predicted PurR-regulated permease PerM